MDDISVDDDDMYIYIYICGLIWVRLAEICSTCFLRARSVAIQGGKRLRRHFATWDDNDWHHWCVQTWRKAWGL